MRAKEFVKHFNRYEPEQDQFEMFQLIKIVDTIKPDKILEIGLRSGASCAMWREAWPDADITAIEVSLKKPRFNRYTRLIHGNSGDKLTRAEAEKHGPYDFLFIDGSHLYSMAKSDWQMYSPLVSVGGLVVFHDSHMHDPPAVDVWPFMKELKRRMSFQTIELRGGPHAPGTTIFYL